MPGQHVNRNVAFGHAMAERRFVGYHSVSSAPGGVTNRAAIAASVARLRTRGRWCPCDTLLQRLAQDLEDVASELREFSEEAPAVVD
jgi:hypothetical protein